MTFRLHSVKGYRRAFFVLLGVLFVFRAWYMSTLPLSGDESYHWEWSRHPAFGYYDHPGLTAYLIRLFTIMLGGSTEFSVRMPALVMLSGTAVVGYYFARFVSHSRGGTDIMAEHAGFMAGLLLLVTPVFGFFSMYISTDPPLIFFWMLSMYLLCRALQSGRWLTWAGAGAAFGFAMLSKFLAFFLLPAVFLFMVISPHDRKWFRRPQLYMAGVVALVVFSPFIWWNATHEWATFMFNFVLRQEKAGFVDIGTLLMRVFVEYIGVQAVCLGIGIFLFAMYYLYSAFREWRLRKDRFALYLGLCSLVPLLYFLYQSTRQTVSLHWPVAGWMGVLVYISCMWPSHSSTSTVTRRLGRASIYISVAILAAVQIVLHVPPHWITGDWKYSGNPGRIDSSKKYELFGWHELGEWVENTRDEMKQVQGKDGAGVFVICNQYGLASNVAFYTPSQIKTHLWRKQKVCGENYRFWDHFESFNGQDAVYVSKKRSRIERATPSLNEHFQDVGGIEELKIMEQGRHVRSFYLVRCRLFNGVEPVFE